MRLTLLSERLDVTENDGDVFLVICKLLAMFPAFHHADNDSTLLIFHFGITLNTF